MASADWTCLINVLIPALRVFRGWDGLPRTPAGPCLLPGGPPNGAAGRGRSRIGPQGPPDPAKLSPDPLPRRRLRPRFNRGRGGYNVRRALEFHDYHLSSYIVSDFGAKITLRLVYDYPPNPKRHSDIEFDSVAGYRFLHTGAAIIVDIAEVTLADLVREIGTDLAEGWRLHGGYAYWNDDQELYVSSLQGQGCHAWKISSAIGFSGYVIAKSISQAPPNKSMDPTP